ncbi:dicarboxylate/amino acid:cation symporter [Clostridium lundense]|uniref:dicarboxylate/amino acid:cation symporter n=1 Tax=Clostridium lundense TaxID=319475 RepID=UPI000686190E|nr:dicarboxylate/amino acid:cation symporter [Clostridium lundense]
MVLLVSLGLLLFLYLLKIKKVSFGNRVLIAMVLGTVMGVIFKSDAKIIEPIGKVYVSLIKMLVVPLVISTIISSITSLENPSKLKKVGVKTVGWLMFTTAMACVIGIIVSTIIQPGVGIQFTKDANFKAREIPTITSVILDMIPSNPVSEMANGKIIPVIIFALLVGIAITIEGAKNVATVKPVKDFFKSFSQIMFRITKMVLKITPYGVLGLMASVASNYGLNTLLSLGKVILAVYIACALQILLVHGSLLAFIVKINPFKFFKKIYPAQAVAFTTRSSYGTLPVTLKSLTNRVKISENIASFVAPMGATMGMNACGGIYPVIVSIFVANIFNIPMTIYSYVLLVIITTMASIGTAGVPGTASIMATVVLSSMGLPVEGIAMVLGIDTILDMARTATNVTGASVVALLVANSENEFNRKGFELENTDELELSA